MKRVFIKSLVPGMISAEDVYSYNNQLLIPKKTVLTDAAITILDMYGVISIRIEDEVFTPVVDEEKNISQDSSYSDRVKGSATFKKFKKNYVTEINQMKSMIATAFAGNKTLDVDNLVDGVISLQSGTKTASGVFDLLHCIREYDDLTFAHSVNVALICNVAATWVGMSEEDIRTATACGLLHDIGKLQIPKNILHKKDKLTDEEYSVIKGHAVSGYHLLREMGVAPAIYNAALMHHERCDGTGYPLGLKANKIDDFSKLVAIADVYDAMTASRVYRGPLCPFTVIELFEQDGLQQYDPRFIMTFLEHVLSTYISNRCRLSNGQEGDIIYINRDKLSRPIVQCGDNYINLADRPELKIECLL